MKKLNQNPKIKKREKHRHCFEEPNGRKWKIFETNVGRRRRKSEKEKQMLRGKGGDLPHAVCVQKWCVDEAGAMVCYHGDVGKGLRGGERRKQDTPSISRASHHPKVPAPSL